MAGSKREAVVLLWDSRRPLVQVASGPGPAPNPTVRKLTFTGSTEVGVKLLAQIAPTVKKASMELGGNAPFIVFDDADLDAAVVGAIASKFRNAGQTCVCANRLLVQDGVYDAFTAKLRAAVEALQVGNGMDPGSCCICPGRRTPRSCWRSPPRSRAGTLA